MDAREAAALFEQLHDSNNSSSSSSSGGSSSSSSSSSKGGRSRRHRLCTAPSAAAKDAFEAERAAQSFGQRRKADLLFAPARRRGSDGSEVAELAANLSAHLAERARASGVDAPTIEVLPVRRRDWYATLTGASFGFYASAIADTVANLHAAHAHRGGVSLACLSASGWIARLALGGAPYKGRVYGLAAKVEALVTLGTPHRSLEAYPFGRILERRRDEDPSLPADVAGSSLRLANVLYPDAASLRPARIACVCGTGVLGSTATLAQRLVGAAAGREAWGDAWEGWLAGVSYRATLGRPDCDGDGVTPTDVAWLPGAARVLLPGVGHLPGRRPWYGSAGVVGLWAPWLSGDPPPLPLPAAPASGPQ